MSLCASRAFEDALLAQPILKFNPGAPEERESIILNKKIWSIALALILLCPPWSPKLMAAEAPQFYMNASKTSLTAGERVEVSIGVRNAEDWVAYELNVAFDTTMWSIEGYNTTLIGFSSIVNPELQSNGKLRAVYTKTGNAAGESGDVLLGTVKLKAKSTGSGAISLETIKIGLSDKQWKEYTPGTRAVISVVSGIETKPSNGTGTGSANPTPVITESAISIAVKPDERGMTTVKLEDKHVQQAIEAMSGSALVIALRQEAPVKAIRLDLPLAGVFGSNKIDAIVVEGGAAKVTIRRSLLNSAEAADATELQLTIAIAERSELSAAVQGKVKPGTVIYDFDLKLDGRSISSFGIGDVTVELPYGLAPGEDADKIIVFYLSQDGELEIVKNARFNRASGKVVFNAAHFSQYYPAHVVRTFRDLNEASWAQGYIEALAAREAVQGIGQDKFAPNGTLTRAQFVKMLIQLFDLADAAAESSFADVLPDNWYYDAVASAERLGIVTGKGNGEFGANEPVSRQDMAVMLYRASQKLQLTWTGHAMSDHDVFKDQASIAPYALEAVEALRRGGMINGMDDGSFVPRGMSTRAQAAAVLYRMFGLQD